MNNDDMQELVQDFLVETNEIIENLDHDLVELENNQNDLELLNKIFRGAHTMKGSSSFLGFNKLAGLTHHAEDILNKLRKSEMVVTREIMDVLLEFVDKTKQIISDIENGTDNTDPSKVIEDLKLASEGKLVGKPKAAQSSGGAAAPAPAAAAPAPAPAPKPAAPKADAKPAAPMEQTIRVDVTRLDSLVNLVGELVLSRNRLSQIAGELENKFENEYLVEQLNEVTSAIGMNTTELQLAIMKTRMIAVGKVFNKFPRVVRDIARDTGKEIDLIITGEETELDKSVVEAIGDPLLHMIRNSCDHGVETPDIRMSKGKNPKGQVILSAYHEGNHVVIEIKDDGAGMDPEKLKRKAVEKRVITPDEANGMDDKQAFSLIFKAGFSTADKITNISGRGVGMDVVRTNIEKLNGIISIDSQVGEGSTFYLKLPLTLAIIQALLVEVAGEIFAIPLVSVVETVRITTDEIHSFEGREVLKLRDRVLSLVRLDEAFALDALDQEEIYVVVVALAEKQLGFIVDKLIGQEEIVIKSLGEYMGGNPGIAGATITGDGRVRLILDVAGIIDLAQNMPRRIKNVKKTSSNKKSSSQVPSKSNAVKVLVCDDSSTDRKIVRKILESQNWIKTVEAPSGKDALAILEREKDIDLLMSDIMMPDMDGFKLSRSVREKGYDIPIIAVSARMESSDRKKISASGINAFIQKPLNQQMLLDKIDELISQKSGSN
ncbi:MAG: hybrid sensor histidine kinase/response regulator [Mucispirillum sp.]|nr:hybrid sensor histidine kinase/response regulator [Mucispirillum sp.]